MNASTDYLFRLDLERPVSLRYDEDNLAGTTASTEDSSEQEPYLVSIDTYLSGVPFCHFDDGTQARQNS